MPVTCDVCGQQYNPLIGSPGGGNGHFCPGPPDASCGYNGHDGCDFGERCVCTPGTVEARVAADAALSRKEPKA